MTNRSTPRPPTILVTDAGRGSAISIMRSLGQQGWNVIAADSDPHSPGFHSRYAKEKLLYPSPEVAPNEFVSVLHKAVSERKVDLLIPVTDAVILPILGTRAQFEKSCRLALPETAALLVTMDKCKTLELAEELGVPIPTTCRVQTVQEALDKGQALGWPIVLKPQVSRLYREQAGITSFEVSYAANEHELAEQMRRYEGICPVLLQEHYGGVGYGVELLMHKGQPVAAFQHKRLREVPLTGGASALRESVALDPTLYCDALRLLNRLEWTGLAMVEFKVGQAGAKLMEINGRVWGSLPLAVQSGMNFPVQLAELYLGEAPPQNAESNLEYAIGVRGRNLELDITWIISVLYGKERYPFFKMPSRRQAATALFELFNPSYRFDILSFRDPLPGLMEIGKIARKLYSKSRQEFA